MCMECVTLAGAVLIAIRNPSRVALVWHVITGWFRG